MDFPESIQVLSCSFWKHYLLFSKFSVTLWIFFLMPSLFLLVTTWKTTGKHKLTKLNFYSCVLIWSYDPLEHGPPHRHLMAVRWLALGCASSFGQGDLRQKAACCCSSGAAVGISEKSWRGQLEDKAHKVCEGVLSVAAVPMCFCCSTQRFILFQSYLFFFKITYHTRIIMAKMNTVFTGWLHLKVPEHLCRHNKPVPAFLVTLCVIVSYFQIVKQSIEYPFDFLETWSQSTA